MKPAPRAPIYRFIWLYALAWTGGAIAYTPFLTLLLPMHVTTLVGPDEGVTWLAQIALIGAISASLSGIGFGFLSDITQNRRGWIAAGLILSSTLLVLIPRATDLTHLLIGIVSWQMALNMMLGPLAAMAGDVVPEGRRGILGGFMAFAPSFGALTGAIVTLPNFAATDARYVWVAALVCVCVIPILVLRLPKNSLASLPQTQSKTAGSLMAVRPKGARRMWLARLLVQTAEAALFSYLLFWLIKLDPTMSENQTAQLFTLTLMISVPIALAAGGWSDVKSRPIAPLVLLAFGSALGLAAMALTKVPANAMIAYSIFGISGAVFLTLHSAQILHVLPRPDRRGRDLGLFNLANTIPSLVMPWLAITIIPRFGFQALFALLAFFALCACALLSSVKKMPSPPSLDTDTSPVREI